MKLRRREFFGILAAPLLRGQGVASRNIKASPRPKPSGIPFLAYFTDIAAQAGLRYPTIYGPVDHKDYIIETVGCGCAFFDYDNDGWMDLLVLSGSRVADVPEGTSSRLYRNNRDGTFTDVTAKAGLLRTLWASGVTVGDYNNDGFDDLFITAYGQNVLYRNNGDGTFTDVTKDCRAARSTNTVGRRLLFRRLQPRWPSRPVRLELSRFRSCSRTEARLQLELHVGGRPSELRTARPALLPSLAISEQRARRLHRRQQRGRNCERTAGIWHDRRCRRFRQRWLA